MAAAMDRAMAAIHAIQTAAREDGETKRPRWPMIVLRSPKGWTGPKFVDGLKTEGSWRAHQVPIADMTKPGHIALLEQWMHSYRPEELFDETGRLRAEIAALAPVGERRMGANPHANGGALMHPLRMPDFCANAVPVKKRGQTDASATKIMGTFLRDVMKLNADSRNFRIVGPDETASNRLQALLEVTGRTWDAATIPDDDEDLSPNGRVMEILSEHNCQGWLEGYLLTGRHGLFSCYEAFIHIIDSMVNQHAKWLKSSRQIEWRRPIASLNYLLTSHVWRQDHNGASHQDPGFMDHVANKKADIARIYLPPDANTLLWVTDHCLRSWDRINLIVAGKDPEPQWLGMDEAITHCEAGLGIWEWASNDKVAGGASDPEVIMACAGDVPTMECMAAVDLLRTHLPDLRIRVINVVDLMTLESKSNHPHGLSDEEFDGLFTTDKPVIFAFHGYPTLIHRLIYNRTNQRNFHVHGFQDEGTTTTPFDMVVLNELDRFHLMGDVIDRVPRLRDNAAYARQEIREKLVEHKRYVRAHGIDMPEIRDWRWSH
jgi:xylulose-5-phosphate/fructose-6-phosphate phosphoketolase